MKVRTMSSVTWQMQMQMQMQRQMQMRMQMQMQNCRCKTLAGWPEASQPESDCR